MQLPVLRRAHHFGSSESEYCVLAMHTGNFPKPQLVKSCSFALAFYSESLRGRHKLPARLSDLRFQSLIRFVNMLCLNARIFSIISTIRRASSSAPAPPFANAVCRALSAPFSWHARSSRSRSASESFGKRLIATTVGNPNLRRICRCCTRFGIPSPDPPRPGSAGSAPSSPAPPRQGSRPSSDRQCQCTSPHPNPPEPHSFTT